MTSAVGVHIALHVPSDQPGIMAAPPSTRTYAAQETTVATDAMQRRLTLVAGRKRSTSTLLSSFYPGIGDTNHLTNHVTDVDMIRLFNNLLTC